MKQIFMDIYDIIPTEGKQLDTRLGGICHYSYWIEDIREKGALFSIKVHPDGHIADGNFRYWCYRHLYEETKDNKWRYIPIEISYLIGNYKYDDVKSITLRHSLISNPPTVELETPIIPSEKELKIYDAYMGYNSNTFCNFDDMILIDLTDKEQQRSEQFFRRSFERLGKKQ